MGCGTSFRQLPLVGWQGGQAGVPLTFPYVTAEGMPDIHAGGQQSVALIVMHGTDYISAPLYFCNGVRDLVVEQLVENGFVRSELMKGKTSCAGSSSNSCGYETLETAGGSTHKVPIANWTVGASLSDNVYVMTPIFMTPLPDVNEVKWPSWVTSILPQIIPNNTLFWDYCEGNKTCQWSFGGVSTKTYQAQHSAFAVLDYILSFSATKHFFQT